MRTFGVLNAGDVLYCLVPDQAREKVEDLPQYFEGGPYPHSVRVDRGEMYDPTGRPIPRRTAIPVLEKDLWSESQYLISIKGWPAYPLSFKALDALPRALLDSIIEQMVVGSTDGSPDATVEINWGGLRRSRTYKMVELAAGVGAWPPRVIRGWKQFFFLFAPGTRALFERQEAAPMFRDREPVLLGYRAAADGSEALVEGETLPMQTAKAAICRLDVPPVALAFRSTRKKDETYGVLPLVFGTSGEIRMPRPQIPERSALARQWTPKTPSPGAPNIRVSIDFGTSNTAVAWKRSDQGALVPFEDGSRAVNLTQDVGMTPVPSSELALRFFPFDHGYRNPLPSTLIEVATEERCLDGTALFPKRSIPGMELTDPAAIQSYAMSDYLKQDFKWKPTPEAEEHRRAFFEHLGLILGWELWKAREAAEWKDVQFVFTSPLAFSYREMDSLTQGITALKDTLRSAGFSLETKEEMISESYANLFFVDQDIRKDVVIRTSAGRHVVIDIGGGTTDISVFTGDGTPLFLDSLYVGGKDIAESLLSYRVTHQGGWEAVAKVLDLQKAAQPARGREKMWTEMVQYVLITRMAADEGRGLSALAQSFSGAGLRDLLGEMVTLLTFTTLYALRLAALGCKAEEIKCFDLEGQDVRDVPPAEEIVVWYAGMGSKLFDLCPLQTKLDRWETAQDVLLKAAKSLPELEKVDITLRREFFKESVCLGALDLFDKDKKTARGTRDIATVWWATFDRKDGSGIHWSGRYVDNLASRFDDEELKNVATNELMECLTTSLRTVGSVTFGNRWEPAAKRLERIPKDFRNRYLAGCQSMRKEAKDMPRHPVRRVTDGIKVDVCELMEES